MHPLIDPVRAAAALTAHANYAYVDALELQRSLEYAAALCRREPLAAELMREVDEDAGVCSGSVLTARDRMKAATP